MDHRMVTLGLCIQALNQGSSCFPAKTCKSISCSCSLDFGNYMHTSHKRKISYFLIQEFLNLCINEWELPTLKPNTVSELQSEAQNSPTKIWTIQLLHTLFTGKLVDHGKATILLILHNEMSNPHAKTCCSNSTNNEDEYSVYPFVN
jgi:hypothetical protein